MKLYIYAAYDNNEEKIFSPGVGIDDQDFCKYFLSELTLAYELIEKEDDKKTFKKKIKQCNLVRLGELNEDGSLVSDMQLLLSLKDIDFDDYERRKKELNNNGKEKN